MTYHAADLDAAKAGVSAGQSAIEAHHAAFGVDEDELRPQGHLFHILVSLIDWADAQETRPDFDLALEDARTHVLARGAA
ncbi:hypothetical protein [Brevundimonas sp. Marseille-Q4549]